MSSQSHFQRALRSFIPFVVRTAMYRIDIENLPPATEWRELSDFLCPPGFGVELGLGFIGLHLSLPGATCEYASHQGACNAIKILHNSCFKGQRISVRHSRQKNTAAISGEEDSSLPVPVQQNVKKPSLDDLLAQVLELPLDEFAKATPDVRAHLVALCEEVVKRNKQ